MDDLNYTELFKLQSAELTERTPFCPEDREIAEYFHDDLDESDRIKLDHHLADCRFCLARVGMLERLERCGSSGRVPEAVLAEAKQLKHTRPGRRWVRAPAWAAAAVVVITLFTIVDRFQESEPGQGVEPAAGISAEESSRQLRSVKRIATELDVISPAPGAEMLPGSVIRWAEIPDTLHYNVYVLSKAGDVLWQERLEGTVWAMQYSPQLSAGSEYYFRVEAFLPDGRTLSSKHLVFRTAEPR